MPSPAARSAALSLLSGPDAVRRWRVVGAALLVAVFVLALHPQPAAALTTGWDKANHLLAFAALAFAWRLALPGGARRWALLAAALAATGVAIEIAQSFVPGREADAADLVADALGAAVGMAVVAAVERFAVRPRR